MFVQRQRIHEIRRVHAKSKTVQGEFESQLALNDPKSISAETIIVTSVARFTLPRIHDRLFFQENLYLCTPVKVNPDVSSYIGNDCNILN